MWVPQIISPNILYTSCISLTLLEAAYKFPETVPEIPGAGELPGPRFVFPSTGRVVGGNVNSNLQGGVSQSNHDMMRCLKITPFISPECGFYYDITASLAELT